MTSRKYLLLYGPLLWLRKIIVYLLITAIVLGLVVYFLANSPLVVKKAADRFAPDYNISYSRIHGNVLTGVEIDDLAYQEELLAKHIILKWNPNGLVKKNIIINDLQIVKANVDTIKTLIASFTDSDNNESNESISTDSSTFSVSVHHASLSFEPFVEQNISVSSAALEIKGAEYVNNSMSIRAIDMQIDSNLTDIVFNAEVKKNHLKGKVYFTPTNELFELYKLPVRKESIGDIVIDIHASPDRVEADLNTQMKQLLKGDKDAFNVDIDSLQSHVLYEVNDGLMKADTKVLLSTPYAKDVLVTNRLTMDNNISYRGEIKAKQIIGIDAKFVKPLNNLQVKYEGDAQSIKADILSDNIQGTFTSTDLKKAQLYLESKEALALNEFIELPEDLNQTRANVVIDVPISFEENASLVANVKIDSDELNVDAKISYEDTLLIETVTSIPKESLLRSYSEELQWDSLFPVRTEAKFRDESMDMILNAGPLSAKVHYMLESTKVDGNITLAGLHADISGIAEEKFTIRTKISSFTSSIEDVKDIYTFTEIPNLEGSADISVEITALKTLDIIFKSPEIIYQPDSKTKHLVNDIDFVVNLEESKVVLKRYTFTYAKQKLFSTEPSTMIYKDDIVSIVPLWLNDQLHITGEYNIKTKKGTIDAGAEKLHIAHEIVDLDSNIDIKTVLDGNKTSVNGKVILLGGNIHYDLSQKTFASDSDIIIVQDMKDQKESPFMDKLSTSVQIQTKSPLIYKKGDIDIQANVDVNVYKAEDSELMVLGSVAVLEGGSYMFEGKKFVFDKSHIYFTGNPNKPLLEASVKYRSVNHLITITVTGTADAPNINFTSKPSLTKEEILSVILFDSEGGAGTNSGDEMMKMMGGAMAKSALSNLGVKLDHLVIGSGTSVEVGKKLTNEITIIYVKDEISHVKLKYKHSKHMQSVIGVSEESQSYDIIYKRDF